MQNVARLKKIETVVNKFCRPTHLTMRQWHHCARGWYWVQTVKWV